MDTPSIKQLQKLVLESISFKHTFVDAGIVSMPTLTCFGMIPVTTLDQLLIAGGASKHSVLCEINFKSGINKVHPNFKLAFITKMHSKIYRKASRQQSEWRAMRTVGSNIELMSIGTMNSEYEFDVFDFMSSEFMHETVQTFISYINNGLASAEKFITTIKDIDEKRQAQNCVVTIKAAIPLLSSTNINDRDYGYSV